jgi:hypothetical protein
MDVVLSSDCKSLSTKPDIVGNNRLRVLLGLQSKDYSQLPYEQQTKMAFDLVKAVTGDWKGRILADKEFSYVILTPNEAIEAMRYLLTPETDRFYATFKRPEPPGEVVRDQKNINALPSSTSSSLTTPKTTLLSSAPPVPDYLRNASKEILEAGKNPHHLLGPEQMQSAAVRSIKERAGKRQMAKGLGSSGRNTSGAGCAKNPTGGCDKEQQEQE